MVIDRFGCQKVDPLRFSTHFGSILELGGLKLYIMQLILSSKIFMR